MASLQHKPAPTMSSVAFSSNMGPHGDQHWVWVRELISVFSLICYLHVAVTATECPDACGGHARGGQPKFSRTAEGMSSAVSVATERDVTSLEERPGGTRPPVRRPLGRPLRRSSSKAHPAQKHLQQGWRWPLRSSLTLNLRTMM